MSLDPTRLGDGLLQPDIRIPWRLLPDFSMINVVRVQLLLSPAGHCRLPQHRRALSLASCLNPSREDDPLEILNDRASSFVYC